MHTADVAETVLTNDEIAELSIPPFGLTLRLGGAHVIDGNS